jgi:hypothetical protein
MGETIKNKREYTKNGKVYPSVTTILSILGSEDLMHWANVMGFKHRYIDDITDAAKNYGTLAHSYVRKIVDPNAPTPIEITDSITKLKIDKLITQFNKLISSREFSTIATEKEMVSEKLGYGGTSDWIVKIDGVLTLVDFKTSSRVKPTMLFQLGGYSNLLAENDIYIEQAAIMLISEDRCELYFKTKDIIEKHAKAFNTLAEFYNQWQELK